jgi:hypothetical protein
MVFCWLSELIHGQTMEGSASWAVVLWARINSEKVTQGLRRSQNLQTVRGACL